MENKNIYLIGPMGAGKSSVGKHLSKLLGYQFYDSDHEIMERTGVTISWIFEVEKEAGFREREANVIAELTKLNKIVLSTGGGCILTEINRRNLKETGLVIYLKVSLDQQLKRTKRTTTRPLLEGTDPRTKLIELNEQREPYYLEIADHTIETDQCNAEDIAQKILVIVKA